MARRRYLIAYDISDPVRLRRVIKVMEAYGQRLQYSVFLCDLSRSEELSWRGEMLDVVNLAADSVVQIDLGPTGASAAVSVMGTPRSLPQAGPTVV